MTHRAAQIAFVFALGACEPATQVVERETPPTATAVVEPRGVTRIRRGDSATLTLVRIDPTDGSRSPLRRDVAWVSSDADVATVDSTGLVRGVGAGYARIIARTDSFADSVWVHLALPDEPAHILHVEFATTISEARRRNARRAAQRWAEILHDSLSSTLLNVAPARCGLGVFWPDSVRGVERGVRILIMSSPMSVAAGTGICERRADGNPSLAFVLVSTDPVNASIDDAWWDRIFFHEFGHALGLVADLTVPVGGRLTGPAMLAGFRHDYGREGMLSYNRSAHWVGVQGDIMDGETGTNARVISRTTLGRLVDMGYAVRLRQSGPLDLARF